MTNFTACDCAKCSSACSHKPGWMMPDQIAPLAAALGLTEQELFDRHLQIDWWVEDDGDDTFVLSPAVVSGEAGKEFDADPQGVCRWFQHGKCAIHELGKPFECAAYLHDDTHDAVSQRHEAVARAWRAPKHQKKIVKLLGREPVSESWEGGLLGMIGPFI